MIKEVDQQNVRAGTSIELPEDKKRARVEVTLNSDELRRLSITTVDDLCQFNFTKLQRRYFQFVLPTFQRNFSSLVAAKTWLSDQRRSKFLASGVVGLGALDAARARTQMPSRASVVASLALTGVRASPLCRNGKGRTGTTVAYDQVNTRVQTALRHLRERMGAGLK